MRARRTRPKAVSVNGQGKIAGESDEDQRAA